MIMYVLRCLKTDFIIVNKVFETVPKALKYRMEHLGRDVAWVDYLEVVA